MALSERELSLVCLNLYIQIARRLLGKILIDLRNTREEAISVAELKGNQDQESTITKTIKEPTPAKAEKESTSGKTVKEEQDHQRISHIKMEDTRRNSFTSDVSMDQEDDDDKEIKYRLDPK